MNHNQRTYFNVRDFISINILCDKIFLLTLGNIHSNILVNPYTFPYNILFAINTSSFVQILYQCYFHAITQSKLSSQMSLVFV